VTEDKSRTDTLQKLNTTQKKQTTQNTAKQNQSGLVASYDTQPGPKWTCSTTLPSPHRATKPLKEGGYTG